GGTQPAAEIRRAARQAAAGGLAAREEHRSAEEGTCRDALDYRAEATGAELARWLDCCCDTACPSNLLLWPPPMRRKPIPGLSCSRRRCCCSMPIAASVTPIPRRRTCSRFRGGSWL